MAIITRPTRTIRWAEGGNQTEPATEKQELGWVIEKPPNEVMNWIHFQQDTVSQYLLQEVGAEWYVEQEYSNTSHVSYNGTRYKAKVANIGKQPDISTDVWDIAYSDYSLTTEFNKVLNTTNYANNLVYKDAPIFRKRAVGTSYEALPGVSINEGYSFKDFSGDGLFHSASPVIMKDGLVVARFEPVTDINDTSKKVVTMDVLQQYLQQYKVGDVYITTTDKDPKEIHGYGTWQRVSEGRSIVGYSSSVTSDTPDWVKIGGNKFGSYTHTLSQNEIPKTRAETLMTRGGNQQTNADWSYLGESDGHANDGVIDSIGYMKSKEFGGGQAHNNVQPSEIFFVWKRTA